MDSTHFDNQVLCPFLWEPVCGCTGNFYSNSCEAYNYGALSCWDGLCPEAMPGGCQVQINHQWSGDTLFVSDASLVGTGDSVLHWWWELNYEGFAMSMDTFLVIPDPGEAFKVSLRIYTAQGCTAYCTYRFASTSTEIPGLLGSRMRVVPNPARHTWQVALPSNGAGRLELCRMDGGVIDIQRVPPGVAELQWNRRGLPAGTYLLAWFDDKGNRAIQRLVLLPE